MSISLVKLQRMIILSAVLLIGSACTTLTMPDKSKLQLASEISSLVWLNSKPLTSKDLRGKVVVVEFWTFDCINCRNTLPYVKGWYEKYREQGLTIVGVHTPELSFERDLDNVKQAVSDYQIGYPVAIDGDFSNWNRYHVMAWPTWFILDKEGYIRYSHIGEGDYSGSEAMIQKLLAE
jgi:thiol-disulfide isomerase/thioredoxin